MWKDWPAITVIIPIIVIMTPTVLTPKDHSTAHVIRDTLEMESRVSVNNIFNIYNYVLFFVMAVGVEGFLLFIHVICEFFFFFSFCLW